MKRNICLLIFIFFSTVSVFASWDSFILKSGKLEIMFYWHFTSDQDGDLGKYETYWDLINLVQYNTEEFGENGLTYTYYLSYNEDTNTYSAHTPDDEIILGSISEIIGEVERDLILEYELKKPYSDDLIIVTIVDIPLRQKNKLLDYSPPDRFFYNFAMNPDRMGFYKRYTLFIFDYKKFNNFIDEIKELDLIIYNEIVGKKDINKLSEYCTLSEK